MKKIYTFLMSLLIVLSCYSTDSIPYVKGVSDNIPVSGDAILQFNSACRFSIEDTASYDTYYWELEVLQEDSLKSYVYATSGQPEFDFVVDDLPGEGSDYKWKIKRYPTEYPQMYGAGYVEAKVKCTGVRSDGAVCELEKNVLLDLLPGVPEIIVRSFDRMENGSYRIVLEFEADRTTGFCFRLTYSSGSGVVMNLGPEITEVEEFVGSGEVLSIIAVNKYGDSESPSLFVDSLIEKFTSIPDVSFPDIAVFPNPTDQYIQWTSTQPDQESIVQIFDGQGRECIRTKKKIGEGNHSIDISMLQEGIYILKTSRGNRSASTRFIKRNFK